MGNFDDVKAFHEKFDLMLAGHSHGGQVRIPFYGPITVPFLVDEYDLGLYYTKAGPLYVNAGIGWFLVGSNQCCVAEQPDMYTDYDDFAISTTGYIGPIGGTSDSSPPR